MKSKIAYILFFLLWVIGIPWVASVFWLNLNCTNIQFPQQFQMSLTGVCAESMFGLLGVMASLVVTLSSWCICALLLYARPHVFLNKKVQAGFYLSASAIGGGWSYFVSRGVQAPTPVSVVFLGCLAGCLEIFLTVKVAHYLNQIQNGATTA